MIVSPFSRQFDRAAFACGKDELDRYLQQRLSQDIKKGVAAGFVLHDDKSAEILGYYTLSALSVGLSDLPESSRKKLPSYPEVPTTLMGRLAISQNHQGQGLGETLLLDALHRAWENRQVVASWAFCVDALDDSAIRFYEHFKFQRVAETHRLFLPMHVIGKLFPESLH